MQIFIGLERLSLGYIPEVELLKHRANTHLTAIENARLLSKMTVTTYTPETGV